MTSEEKQTFVLRITEANKTELIVVMQDILIKYLDDAKFELEQKADGNEYYENISMARNCITELRSALNMNYDLSNHLCALYNFWDRELAKAMLGRKAERISKVRSMVKKLRDANAVVSKQDTSGPLMMNTQKVVAGMTYGRGYQLNESVTSANLNRGYLA